MHISENGPSSLPIFSDSDVKPHKQHSQALESAMWEAESACLQLHRHPP